MGTIAPIMLSYVVEQVMLTNYSREEFLQANRIYSKYYERVIKRFDSGNEFKKKIEIAKFEKYFSLCYLTLTDWYDELNLSYELIKNFVEQNSFFPLTENFFGLQDDFTILCKRFEEITYACTNKLKTDKKSVEFNILSYEEAAEIFINPAQVKPTHAPMNTLWEETVFFITKAENLQERLFDIMDKIRELEESLSYSLVADLHVVRVSYKSLAKEANTVFSELESIHEDIDKKMALFYYSGKYAEDKTRVKFEACFEELYLPFYLGISLEAVLKTCNFLINCYQTSDS